MTSCQQWTQNDEQMKLARQNTQLKKQKFLKQNKIKR